MRWRSVSVIIGVCFILGLLIAPAIRPAQACSCVGEGYWILQLEAIDGDGDRSVEEEFWAAEAMLTGFDLNFRDDDGGFVSLRRIQ